VSKTRQPVKALNQTPATVAANAKAEKARKAASKAVLKAQNEATYDGKADAPKPPPVDEVAAAVAEAERLERKQADEAAFRRTLEEDARALGHTTPEAVAAYVADQLAPAEGTSGAKTPYNGPMLALKRARLAYVKAANGVQCNGDKLALLCGQHPREVVVSALVDALKLPGNPYLHLNPGQQSMNLRNKARHAVSEGRLSLGEVEAHLKAHATKAA
jgi:hypothetical protein